MVVEGAADSSALFAGRTEDAFVLGARAYAWGFAFVAATRLRQSMTRPEDPFGERPATSPGAALNNVGNQRRLSDPSFVGGVAPNVDTLYSVAWLDLADEAFVLETPHFGSRYYTFQLAYGDGSTDVSLGRRTHGAQLPPVFVAAHDDPAPPPSGMAVLRSPTRYAMIAGRILVGPDDADDLEAVHTLQAAIRVRPWSKYRAGDESLPNAARDERPLDPVDEREPALRFLHRLGTVLADAVPAHEYALADSFAGISLSRERGFEPATLSAETTDALVRGLRHGADLVEERALHLGTDVNGWTTNYGGPRFGDDYVLRSAVARDQIYVTVPEEALYPAAAVDAEGEPLVGENAYGITFPAGRLPPVFAFWSLTMYARNPPLVANPIDRYAVGDRTPGLVFGRDGSLSIHIQHAHPAAAHVNWLPAPRGPFRLMLRLYVPHAAALDGSWTPPPVERAEHL